jgi:hydroxyacylglutathione hydrolase
MQQEIMVFNSQYLGVTANCYLIKTDTGYLLIDTGWSTKRDSLLKDLENAGCKPGNLKLIILTHGDFDHTGNGAYLREKYATRIVMHRDDAQTVMSGDMFVTKKIAPLAKIAAKILLSFIRLGHFETFQPDLCIEDGQDLSIYGIDASSIHLPGHSKGSIGILTTAGDLFCGDLLENTKKPAVNTLVDDPIQMAASIEKLKKLPIKKVYPGHGSPFLVEQLFMTP